MIYNPIVVWDSWSHLPCSHPKLNAVNHISMHTVLVCFGLLCFYMMTSSNGNIFRVTGPLCGEFTGPGEFPTQRPVTRSFDVFFDLRLNNQLSKHSWGWWFERLSWSLWRHHNDHHRPMIHWYSFTTKVAALAPVPQFLWSNPGRYGKNGCYLTTKKHKKMWKMCIVL